MKYFTFEQTYNKIITKSYRYELLNNGYQIDGCKFGELYYDNIEHNYIEVGFDSDNSVIYFRLKEAL